LEQKQTFGRQNFPENVSAIRHESFFLGEIGEILGYEEIIIEPGNKMIFLFLYLGKAISLLFAK